MLTSGALLQNRYRIVQPLGSGGQGAVYLALHLGLNTYVAIKESFSNDPTANAQFQTEANLLAHLSHPNLPRVTDFFVESNGARYLVMEYVQGENLEKIAQLRGAPISESEALNWSRQIFDAVKYLHANRVIHRDIKPQNIIITPNGRAVLVDFGIAKVMASGALTGASMRFGSPGYAPPEQYSGGTDERSDIYALGATLYFVLTGQTPPEAPLRAAGTILPPPSHTNPQISPHIEYAILSALNLNAAQRYGSVADFAQSIYAVPTQPLGVKTAIPTASVQQAAAIGAMTSPRTDTRGILFGSLVGGIVLTALIFGGLFLGGFFGGRDPAPTAISFAPSIMPPTMTPSAMPIPPTATTAPTATAPPTTPPPPPTSLPISTATSTSTSVPTVTKSPSPTNTPRPTNTPTVVATVVPFTNTPKPTRALPKSTSTAAASGLSKIVTVQANQTWQDTGVFAQAGETVVISFVSGEWCAWRGGCGIPTNSGAGGGIIPQVGFIGLVGRIGADQPFAIGTNTFVKPRSLGRVLMQINDSDVSDNTGAIQAKVSISNPLPLPANTTRFSQPKSYPAPILFVEPADLNRNDVGCSAPLRLTWSWEGQLAADEYFEIQNPPLRVKENYWDIPSGKRVDGTCHRGKNYQSIVYAGNNYDFRVRVVNGTLDTRTGAALSPYSNSITITFSK